MSAMKMMEAHMCMVVFIFVVFFFSNLHFYISNMGRQRILLYYISQHIFVVFVVNRDRRTIGKLEKKLNV